METFEITVEGMTCEHCVRRVERALLSTGKAHNVKVDLSTGKVIFEKEESLTLEEIRSLLEGYGYQVKA
ncbi:MAG: heavy-metal-associated domain-containing protein [Caldimicrobium sp.]|nr:heavy-metal-associated domain-containing protein [Caldimicrobium sp.]MCX7874132.1 heavy-metal-associated domain-containing protein [Caldimicrobium sp.]MDW8093733.1 heavy metal-associated domain-containing protein [Caldimicrobium sp.]